MTTDMIKIYEIAKQYKNLNYDFIGIRIQEETFGLEKDCIVNYNSKSWDFNGNMTIDLDGICAVDAKRINEYDAKNDNRKYFGNVIVILASNDATRGEDHNEIIIKNAVVIDVL